VSRPSRAVKSSAASTDGRVSRAQRLRASRRAQVLGVARQVFSAKGYHSTSIDDLIAAAGIARGTFYLYFESKRAIFEALLDELFALLAASVRRIDTRPEAPPPVEQMNQIVDQVFATLVDNREIARILLREAVGIDKDFDRKLADFYGRLQDLITRAVEAGIEMGLVRPLDSRVVARCILGAAKEVVYAAFVDSDPAEPDPRHLGRELIAFTLTGLFKTP
jgi:AcrR family transcriptional regulator